MKSAELFDLTGKVSLVTGARTGLGHAMAVALAGAGADIIGLGSSAMPDTRKRIEALGRRFEEIICDLSNNAHVPSLGPGFPPSQSWGFASEDRSPG